MTALLNIFLGNPLLYIGGFFAFLAAMSFLVFLRGFLSGFPNLLTQNENAAHLHHYRTRAVWGVLLLIVVFLVWEIVRWFFGLFS